MEKRDNGVPFKLGDDWFVYSTLLRQEYHVVVSNIDFTSPWSHLEAGLPYAVGHKTITFRITDPRPDAQGRYLYKHTSMEKT